MSAETWEPFGLPEDAYTETADGRGQKILNISWRKPRSERGDIGEGDSAGRWLRAALIALGFLAATAAAVSYAAQFFMVLAVKGVAWVAALEAGIPDAGSVVFACLGIALAMRGKRALRSRALNLGCVALSIGMNALAARSGWRDVAIWVMPAAVYALASDTLIGVIRAYVMSRLEQADDERTLLDAISGLVLWTLRVILAPSSTLSGLRGWVLEAAPVAPGRVAAVTAANAAALPAAETPGSVATPTAGPDLPALPAPKRPGASRGKSKTARFLALVADRYGDLAGIDLDKVSRIASELAPEVDFDLGSARRELRTRVLAAQGGAR
jgi:hypothetical protein